MQVNPVLAAGRAGCSCVGLFNKHFLEQASSLAFAFLWDGHSVCSLPLFALVESQNLHILNPPSAAACPFPGPNYRFSSCGQCLPLGKGMKSCGELPHAFLTYFNPQLQVIPLFNKAMFTAASFCWAADTCDLHRSKTTFAYSWVQGWCLGRQRHSVK